MVTVRKLLPEKNATKAGHGISCSYAFMGGLKNEVEIYEGDVIALVVPAATPNHYKESVVKYPYCPVFRPFPFGLHYALVLLEQHTHLNKDCFIISFTPHSK